METLPDDTFKKEVLWCLDHLKRGMQSGRLSQKQMNEAVLALKVLQNPKASMPKKRQAMRTTCGDYRTKMQQEEKSFKLDAKVTKKSLPSKKSHFIRQSMVKERLKSDLPAVDGSSTGSGPQPFRFDFGEQSTSVVVQTAEEAILTKKFKFKPSDNTFRFGFSNDS